MGTARDPGPPSSPEPSVAAAKQVLRTRMRAIRRVIASDGPRRLERSSVICGRLIAVVMAQLERTQGARSSSPDDPSAPVARMPGVARIMVFDALAGEPNLTELVEWTGARGIALYLPRVDGDALRVDPGDIDPATLDVVVVPGVAFTRAGHRLGQGGGHFDRFLPRLARNCLRIGVGFREQLIEHLPVEPHDVALDLIVTDE